MKEITDVTQLEIGKYYHLFDKNTNKFVGTELLEWNPSDVLKEVIHEGKTYHDVKAAHFYRGVWTHIGNNPGMERWSIFGPVFKEGGPSIEEIRALCEKEIVPTIASFKIKRGGGEFIIRTCSCRQCKGGSLHDLPPMYYSTIQALDSGWVLTKDPLVSEEGNAVFVCPTCVEIIKTGEKV